MRLAGRVRFHRSTRRSFLKLAVGAAGAAIASDAAFWEPYHPRLTRIDVVIRNLSEALDGFTIAQLSDFHYDPYFGARQIRAGMDLAAKLSPDLVVLTGDFVTVPLIRTRTSHRKAAETAGPCADLLAGLKSRLGSYAILGNHDVGTDERIVTEALQRREIPILKNRAVPVEKDGGRFWLAGVDDVMMGRPDLDQTLRTCEKGEPVVLLAHEPDFADYAAQYPIDLQLSGHSHGGQIRLPFVVPLYLPPLARKYPWGMRQVEGMTLYTNVGVGTIHVPMRWNCLPEVTLVTLKRNGRRPEP